MALNGPTGQSRNKIISEQLILTLQRQLRVLNSDFFIIIVTKIPKTKDSIYENTDIIANPSFSV